MATVVSRGKSGWEESDGPSHNGRYGKPIRFWPVARVTPDFYKLSRSWAGVEYRLRGVRAPVPVE